MSHASRSTRQIAFGLTTRSRKEAPGKLRSFFHQLRRGCSSLLRSAGVDPIVISEVMGHTDTRLTERVYTDVFAEAKRAAMDRLGALLVAEV